MINDKCDQTTEKKTFGYTEDELLQIIDNSRIYSRNRQLSLDFGPKLPILGGLVEYLEKVSGTLEDEAFNKMFFEGVRQFIEEDNYDVV
ncbi:MAG: hypothetical protein ABIB43_05845 [archaeon]